MELQSIYARNLRQRNLDMKDDLGLNKTEIIEEKGNDFTKLLEDGLNQVNNRQVKADGLTEGFIRGEVEDLHEVLIATEEARLSLELATKVRNKLVEAFKEINNMQI